MNHSHEIAGLWAQALTASTAVGGEAEATRTVKSRWQARTVSRGASQRASARRMSWTRCSVTGAVAGATTSAAQNMRVSGPDRRGSNPPIETPSPYQDDDGEGGDPSGATRRASPEAEVQA